MVKGNINNGNKDLSFFEVGRIYKKCANAGHPIEEDLISVCVTGSSFMNWKDHSREVTFYDIKGKVEAVLCKLGLAQTVFSESKELFLSEAVKVQVGGEDIGFIGQVDKTVANYFDVKQTVFYAELNVKALHLVSQMKTVFKPFSKFPSSYRDLSITLANDIHVRDVKDAISSCGTELLREVQLFDQYTGKQVEKGMKSLSFSLRFQSDERTLSSEEVEDLHTKILSVIGEKFNAKLRA